MHNAIKYTTTKKNVSLVFGRQLHISSHKQFFFSIWVNLNCKLCEFVVDQMLLMFCWQLSQPQFSTSTLRPCIIAPVQTSREKMEMEKKTSNWIYSQWTKSLDWQIPMTHNFYMLIFHFLFVQLIQIDIREKINYLLTTSCGNIYTWNERDSIFRVILD